VLLFVGIWKNSLLVVLMEVLAQDDIKHHLYSPFMFRYNVFEFHSNKETYSLYYGKTNNFKALLPALRHCYLFLTNTNVRLRFSVLRFYAPDWLQCWLKELRIFRLCALCGQSAFLQ